MVLVSLELVMGQPSLQEPGLCEYPELEMRLDGDGSLAKGPAWCALPPLAGTRHWCCGTDGRVLPGCCCSGYNLCQVLCPLVRPLPAASPDLAAAC